MVLVRAGNSGAPRWRGTPGEGVKSQNAPKLDTSNPHLLTAQKGSILTKEKLIGSQKKVLWLTARVVADGVV